MPVKPPQHRLVQKAVPVDYSGIRKLRSSQTWKDVRAIKLSTSPLCEVCQAKNIVNTAEQVHHILGLAKRPDLAFDLSNLKSVCAPCHATIERCKNRFGSYQE